MGFYTDHVLPRALDFSLSRKPVLKLRERVARGLSGEVVEIGFGSGLNVPYYPRSVTKVHAVDPSELGRRLAKARVDASPVPIEWSGLDGQQLALPSASVDMALSTFTLCTIPDAVAALREVKRVLKPNGRLLFLEHGRHPDASVSKWQDRLNPLQNVLGGGCNVNRPIADLIRQAGFCLDHLQNFHLMGPKCAGYMYEGIARACDCNDELAQPQVSEARA